MYVHLYACGSFRKVCVWLVQLKFPKAQELQVLSQTSTSKLDTPRVQNLSMCPAYPCPTLRLLTHLGPSLNHSLCSAPTCHLPVSVLCQALSALCTVELVYALVHPHAGTITHLASLTLH